ncbi:hypothetical protein RSAG8_11201, partial [Rhizoctonia solani AG-8 WAC10335]
MLLFKASLFSAISTGFIIESSKDLRSNPVETTIAAICQLTAAVRIGLQPSGGADELQLALEIPEAPFKPSAISIWVNCLWYMSLGLSISVSLFAMLAKLWCYKTRTRHKGTQYDRVVKHQETWGAAEQWKMEVFIVQLPVLMHVAVVLFIIGLVLYLSGIHQITMIVTTVPVTGTILVYLGSIFLQALIPSCPMGTPFTKPLRAGINHLSILVQLLLHTTKSIIQSLRYVIHNPLLDYSPKRQDIIDNSNSFQALIWLLRSSNDKKIVTAVLEHISSFPEVILVSNASSSQLRKAVKSLCAHIRRMRHDTIEWYDTNDLKFIWGCDNFMQLAARPWLHSGPEDVDSMKKMASDIPAYRVMAKTLSPHMEKDLTLDERKAGLDKQKTGSDEREKSPAKIKNSPTEPKFAIPEGLPWLERSAVLIVLDILPEHGLTMCKALWEFISTKEGPNAQPENDSYLALWWIFLNCVLDCRSSDERTGSYFWPSDKCSRKGFEAGSSNGQGTLITGVDSTLTLTYFRHAQSRREHAHWLTIVGIPCMLQVFTYEPFQRHNTGPNDSNKEYFETLIAILTTTLNKATDRDRYFGSLPIYSGTKVFLHTVNSLEYGHEAIKRAIESSAYQDFSPNLVTLRRIFSEKRNQMASKFTMADQGVP